MLAMLPVGGGQGNARTQAGQALRSVLAASARPWGLPF